jgi:signal transduction histidine kinase
VDPGAGRLTVNVLVVEDSRTQAEHLRQMLERAGVRVTVALDGETALAKAKEPRDAGNAFDLVLSDIVMPKMTGYELTRRLREDPATRELPVVLMTSLSEPEDVVRALAAGADNFVNKPYQARELVSRLERTLAAKRRGASSLEVPVRGETLTVNQPTPTVLAVLVSALEDAATRNAELEASRRQLAEVTRERENLLSIVAHELRAPLNVLVMRAALDGRQQSGERGSRPPAEPLPQVVSKQVGKMVALLDDLLDTARLETGNLKLDPLPSDLVALSREAVNAARLVSTHELSIEVIGSPPLVHADPQRVGQVLTNFLTNAMKYSPAGSAILLAVEATPAAVRVSVTDHGIGVPAADREHVFDRYFRSESGRRAGQGLGLGLAICRQLVEQHAGRIGVTSEEGKGSTFWFELPITGAS